MGHQQPNMELFLVGLYMSVNLVVWGTMMIATYVGLKLSESAPWNPKLTVVSSRPVSAYEQLEDVNRNAAEILSSSSDDWGD